MAYDVKFTIPARPLERADIEFVVKNDDGTLGTLKVSKGSLVWFPSGTTYGCKVGWKQFDALMDQHATREEKR